MLVLFSSATFESSRVRPDSKERVRLKNAHGDQQSCVGSLEVAMSIEL